MTSLILVLPLIVNMAVAYYIRKNATRDVSEKATWLLVALVVIFVIIYVPSVIPLTKDQMELTGGIPDFIEANLLWGGWPLTEVWLTATIFDAVYSLSGTRLTDVKNFGWYLHLFVGLGFFLLAYSYFAPLINKLMATNQTQPTNQTRTT